MIDYKKYISGKKDWIDMTKLFLDPIVSASLVEDMTRPFESKKIDRVVAVDALGFVFAARIAERLNAGLILARKGGKIEIEKKEVSFTDYSKTEKTLEIAKEAFAGGERVLIVDDWSETGSQLKATVKLVESLGGKVAGISCAHIDDEVLKDGALSKYMMHSVMGNL